MALKRWEGYRDEHPKLYGGLEAVVSAVRPYIPPLNFITLHYAYFITTTIVATLIFWGSSSPAKSISWWDSMFMCMSAVTGSGLNTINVSQLTTFQQVVLVILMIIGSQVLVSYFTVAFRKHIFEKRFEDIVEMEKENRKARKGRTGAVVGMTGAMFGLPVMSNFGKGRKQSRSRPPLQKFSTDPASPNHTRFSAGRASDPGPGAEYPPSPLESGTDQPVHVGFLEPIREGRTSKLQERPQSATTGHSIYNVHSNQSASTRLTHGRTRSEDTKLGGDDFNVQTFLKEQKRNIGRNGQFYNLSSDQREYLGGVEYRALKFLSVFVLLYFILWQLFGAIALGAYMSVYEKEASAVNAQNPWWAGIFLAISAYNNTGFTLLDAGFIPFQDSYYILTIVTILSLAGPAAFPVFIRFLVWAMSKLLYLFSGSKEYGMWREGFDFILKFPRRVYTSMFAARDTWLFIITFGSFVAADWVLILILSIGNPTMEVIPLGRRIFISLFEGFSIPSGGYAIVSPSGMYFDVQVLWLVIFYTAAYPHIITMRKTNVYEERSLGIYEGDEAEEEQLHSASSSLFDVDAAIPSAADASSEKPSNVRIRKIGSVGRRGTAFVGRQIQRRMTAFQGVGVAHPTTSANAPEPLRRAAVVDFSRASTHSLQNHPPTKPPSLISQQVRGQLSHDVWWIALALFLITLIETHHSIEDPRTYSVFTILFEIVSGYTNIGISVGLPDQAYSFSGGMYTGSKVIMILVMLRGRHRGLPVALDRAVRLPGKKLAEYEEEDAEIRSMFSR
ncbi:TrkH-domain-containing protein [Lophiostoma macrostomum CBS 122681]|uniref:TrkH-domain-containing protein n=1 Tax=Lophiostoma macrostomum CBS 122681 TaxID=1314788 RepID=A0A6A6TLP5_9PLEO|nr:TrkH-domain-containing protein [Lophiostoma macrostomum CBS 122681]